jgi:hypothetical protein
MNQVRGVAPADDARAIAELQTVMQLISVVLEEVAATAPFGHRQLVPNALLNLAVERMLAALAPRSTAAILYRLADLIAAGARPAGSAAFSLTNHDA